jgi:hypothetical protein
VRSRVYFVLHLLVRGWPDITQQFLGDNGLELVVHSHKVSWMWRQLCAVWLYFHLHI